MKKLIGFTAPSCKVKLIDFQMSEGITNLILEPFDCAEDLPLKPLELTLSPLTRENQLIDERLIQLIEAKADLNFDQVDPYMLDKTKKQV